MKIKLLTKITLSTFLTVLFLSLGTQKASAQCYTWFVSGGEYDCRQVACPQPNSPTNITNWVAESCDDAPKPPIARADGESDSLGGAITNDDFDALNPLKVGGGDELLTTPGGIISKLLEFAFPLAGIILFVMLVWGGFEILYGSSTSKSMEAGKNRITAAIIGFFLLFASFWIIQILEVIFGVKIIL